MVSSERLRDKINRMALRYDGENDLILGAPVVTWSDFELLDIISSLLAMVEDLQKQINDLEKEIKDERK
jgi:hypothetical protein